MRIVIVNNLYAPFERGGAERSVRSLAEELVRLGAEIVVVCLAPIRRPRAEVIGGVEVRYLPLRNLYWPFGERSRSPALRWLWHAKDRWNGAAARDVAKILREVRPEIVHTNNLAGLSASIWSAGRASGCPIVHTLRDYYLLCPRSTMRRRGARGESEDCRSVCGTCRWASAPRRRETETVDHVASISRFVLERHRTFGCFCDTPASVIVNGVRPVDVLESVDACGGPLRLGYLGRLHADKGVELLLREFRDHPERHRMSLSIAGTGTEDYRRRIERLAEESGAALVGELDPAEFWPNIDVVVVPSLWDEPLSRVAAEAQGAGRVVVAARSGGLPEIVEHGRTGFFFDPGRPGALGAQLTELLDDPSKRREVAIEARARAAAFAPSAIAKSYAHVYDSVVESARARESSRVHAARRDSPSTTEGVG